MRVTRSVASVAISAIAGSVTMTIGHTVSIACLGICFSFSLVVSAVPLVGVARCAIAMPVSMSTIAMTMANRCVAIAGVSLSRDLSSKCSNGEECFHVGLMSTL